MIKQCVICGRFFRTRTKSRIDLTCGPAHSAEHHKNLRRRWGQANRAYQTSKMLAWRAANPDRSKATQARYLAKNIDKVRARNKKYYWNTRKERIASKHHYNRAIGKLVSVLRETKPELLKEFGL